MCLLCRDEFENSSLYFYVEKYREIRYNLCIYCHTYNCCLVGHIFRWGDSMYFKRLLTVICALFAVVIAMLYGYKVGMHCEILQTQSAFILVDAGHGGADNGTSAADGTAEDGINLDISLQLYDLLRFCGMTVRMTRSEDISVTDEDADRSRGWKANDMYARLRQYDMADFTVSIHQNHFSQSKYYGTQVFYGSQHAESKVLADDIQKQVVSFLQPQNKRAIKSAGENIFLLHRTTRPAVIVECGFLSNPTEAALLKSKQYQQQMAFAICCGVLEYTAKG